MAVMSCTCFFSDIFTFIIVLMLYLYMCASVHRIIQQTQNIFITFIQRRTNNFDVGSTLHKCYTSILCLLDVSVYVLCFDVSFLVLMITNITRICLFLTVS